MISYARSIARSFPRHLTPAIFREDIFSSRTQVVTDSIAGLTVAIVLIPQALGYALLLGIPPVNGLYAAFFGVLFGALWGSSRLMVTGPVGVMSLLAAAALVPFAGLPPEQMVVLAAALALMVGIVQLVLGLLKLGFVMRLVPQAVLIGFSAGAAVVIAVTQIPALLGLTVESHAFMFQSILATARHMSEFHAMTSLVAICSVVGIVLLRRVGKTFPAALMVIIIAAAASYAFHFAAQGVAVIGTIPTALPTLRGFDATDLLTFGSTSIVMALVGFLGSFAVARSLAAHTRDKIDVDHELVGQGLANIASGLFRGYPVSGSFSISALNYDVGARTVLSGVVTAVCVAGAIVFLSPVLYFLPRATLAAVIVVSTMGLIKPSELRHVYRVSRTDGIIALITFVAAFLLQPQDAVMIGVVIALLMLLRNVMWVEVPEVGFHREWQTLQSVGKHVEVETVPHVLIVRVDQSFIYANAERILDEVHARITERQERDSQPVRAVICNFYGVNDIDSSGIEALEEMEHEFERRGMRFAVAYVKGQVQTVLARAHLPHTTFLHNIDEIRAWCAEVERK